MVFDDADPRLRFRARSPGADQPGQDCTAATRAIVAAELYDDFVAGVAEVMGKMVVGDPRDADTDLGPLISFAHRDKVAGMVARAPGQGARVVAGGKSPDLPGAFFLPTLLADVSEESEVYRDEIFGPVLTVRRHEGMTTPYGRPTTPSTVWPHRRGPGRLSGPTGVAGDQGRLRGSMTTSRSSARCRMAAPVRPASARTCRTTLRGVPDHQACDE